MDHCLATFFQVYRILRLFSQYCQKLDRKLPTEWEDIPLIIKTLISKIKIIEIKLRKKYLTFSGYYNEFTCFFEC